MLRDQKVKTKIQISWEQKELLRWSKKHFSSFFKGFQLPKLFQTWECAFKMILNALRVQVHDNLFHAKYIIIQNKNRHNKQCKYRLITFIMHSKRNSSSCLKNVSIRNPSSYVFVSLLLTAQTLQNHRAVVLLKHQNKFSLQKKYLK